MNVRVEYQYKKDGVEYLYINSSITISVSRMFNSDHIIPTHSNSPNKYRVVEVGFQ